jgi:hypothetical protein
MKRPIRKMLRPLRLRLINWQMKHSENEIQRLRSLRSALIYLEGIEHVHQVRLVIRRAQIEQSGSCAAS